MLMTALEHATTIIMLLQKDQLLKDIITIASIIIMVTMTEKALNC